MILFEASRSNFTMTLAKMSYFRAILPQSVKSFAKLVFVRYNPAKVAKVRILRSLASD